MGREGVGEGGGTTGAVGAKGKERTGNNKGGNSGSTEDGI